MPPENAIAKTFLVEHYEPGLAGSGPDVFAGRLRAAAEELRREGEHVRDLCFTFLPGDECLLCFFEAGSEQLVRAVYARADLGFDRVSWAIALDEGHPTSRTDPEEERG